MADWEQMGREQRGDKLWYGEGFEGNNGEQVADWEQMGREQRGDKLWYGEGFEGNKWRTGNRWVGNREGTSCGMVKVLKGTSGGLGTDG